MAGATKPAAPRKFSLTVGGAELVGFVPVEGVRFTEVGPDAQGTLEFTVEDPAGGVVIRVGQDVQLTDLRNAAAPRILWAGVVLAFSKRRGARGRIWTVRAVDYDAWLDWHVVGKVSLAATLSDQVMVQRIVSGWAGNLTAPATTVQLTQGAGSMDAIASTGDTVRTVIGTIADTATTLADSPTRMVYVDNRKQVHYYRDVEGQAAPFAIRDGFYTTTVLSLAGALVSLWTMRETSGLVYDAQGYANGTLAGGTTRGTAPLAVNEEQGNSISFNGTTGFLSATGANLHQSDGPWTIELWFLREDLTVRAQALWSGGTNDIYIGFDATFHLVVEKEGTGSNWVSTDIFTDSSRHHLVVQRPAGGPTAIYVDGVLAAGTTTVRTFASAGGTVEIGRRKSATDRYFGGRLQNVALYNLAIGTANITEHWAQGTAIGGDDLEVTYDATDYRNVVYVNGGNVAGSGWVRAAHPVNVDFESGLAATISRPDSMTARKLTSYGRAFISQHGIDISGQVSVTGHDGWRCGQLLSITDALLAPGGITAEIKQIDTDVNFGSGVMTYTLHFGKLPHSVMRRLAKLNSRPRMQSQGAA